MDNLFSHITVADIHHDVLRNIVSLNASENPFDDLSSNTEEWFLARQVESDTRPKPYAVEHPEIHKPFEEALWLNAITWPFKNRQTSRFSDGSFGVWYGSDRLETSVHESAYHWFRGLLCDAGFEHEEVTIERTLYAVACEALLLDFCPVAANYPTLLHKTDYTYTQSIGARIHREGHPGLLTFSVRNQGGINYAVLNPNVLSNPRQQSQLSYRLHGQTIVVEENHGAPCMEIAIDALWS
jgi:RES domain